MSTRAQVVIREHDEVVGCLYHHWDGYPSNMIELLQKAERKFRREKYTHSSKAINFIIAADPACYEIEELSAVGRHWDVEYNYTVTIQPLIPCAKKDKKAPWLLCVDSSHKGEAGFVGELNAATVTGYKDITG